MMETEYSYWEWFVDLKTVIAFNGSCLVNTLKYSSYLASQILLHYRLANHIVDYLMKLAYFWVSCLDLKIYKYPKHSSFFQTQTSFLPDCKECCLFFVKPFVSRPSNAGTFGKLLSLLDVFARSKEE